MDCSQTWLGFFLPSGRSYNCGILLGLEELLTSSPSYQLGRIVVLVLGLAKKFSRVLEWQFGVWGLFLQVLFPPKNKQNLCTLGVLTPFLIYWYADLLCVREKKSEFILCATNSSSFDPIVVYGYFESTSCYLLDMHKWPLAWVKLWLGWSHYSCFCLLWLFWSWISYEVVASLWLHGCHCSCFLMTVVSAHAYPVRTCGLRNVRGCIMFVDFDHGMLLFPCFLYQMGDELIMASLYLLDFRDEFTC